MNLDGLQKINHYYGDLPAQNAINELATQNVADKFKEEASHPASPILKKWIGIVDKIKRDNPTVRERKKLITDGWKNFKLSNNITDADKKQVALWASLSPNANLSWGIYNTRPISLINEAPDVAKAFFEGENKYKNLKDILNK